MPCFHKQVEVVAIWICMNPPDIFLHLYDWFHNTVGSPYPSVFLPVTCHAGIRGRRVRAPLILNLGARWSECSSPRLGRFSPGKERRYPLYRRLDGPHGRSERVGVNVWLPPGFEPQTTSVPSRNTDYAVPLGISWLFRSKCDGWERWMCSNRQTY